MRELKFLQSRVKAARNTPLRYKMSLKKERADSWKHICACGRFNWLKQNPPPPPKLHSASICAASGGLWANDQRGEWGIQIHRHLHIDGATAAMHSSVARKGYIQILKNMKQRFVLICQRILSKTVAKDQLLISSVGRCRQHISSPPFLSSTPGMGDTTATAGGFSSPTWITLPSRQRPSLS